MIKVIKEAARKLDDNYQDSVKSLGELLIMQLGFKSTSEKVYAL
jgi:hypothetical protein